jgi:site-specific recombinase XerD
MTSPPPASAATCLTSPTCLNSKNSISPGTFQDQLQITYVSHLIEDGVDPLFVQQQAGHSWASTTATYTTVGQDARNRMLRSALARAFGEDGR